MKKRRKNTQRQADEKFLSVFLFITGSFESFSWMEFVSYVTMFRGFRVKLKANFLFQEEILTNL